MEHKNSPQGELENNESEAERVLRVVRELNPGAEGVFDSHGNGYITTNFTDQNKRWVEARIIRSTKKLGAFILNANIGDPLALLELKQKLEKGGIPIDRLVSYFADDETQEILANASKS